ncbi:MAG: hypothetical protein ABW104_14085 [Candidatus Thiodiazotropha sp. 6PLUC2]
MCSSKSGNGNHVTPIDHQYYVAPDFGENESIEIDVYSPADGTVSSIQHMGNFNNDDYRFVVDHAENLQSIYIHVDNLSDKLAAYAPADASISSGLVKYDLVSYDYYDNGIPWDRSSFSQGLTMDNYTFIDAVVLVQLRVAEYTEQPTRVITSIEWC